MKLFYTISFLFLITYSQAQHTEVFLEKNWKFHKGDSKHAEKPNFDDSNWETIRIPHDWAIYGPFDKKNDLQKVAVVQNGEKIATEKTGRTGGLPYMGVGWYRRNFKIPNLSDSKKVILQFDGAMSNAEVFINGQKVGYWPNGYNYFYFDISKYIHKNGKNCLAVKLTNKPYSSRWYPGAGLYRNVRLIVKEKISIKHWGTTITTPDITTTTARVHLKTQVNSGENLQLQTDIVDTNGYVVSSSKTSKYSKNTFEQNLEISNPKLWDLQTPTLYTAISKLYQGNILKDTYKTTFGIREITFKKDKGFFLNKRKTKFKGVCLHHDLGPLGTAINKAALKRQLVILKKMGINAIRSAHNMPSLEQIELCDELGILLLAESFDEWYKAKVKNGYHLYFEKWVEKDIQNLVRATRNHPSIVMWSAGNEVPDQWSSEGVERAKKILAIFHKEDPTRPVTIGMDQVKSVMKNGFGSVFDIPGLNYRVHLYEEAYKKFPQKLLLGSETASTVSSRGVYKFPVEKGMMKKHKDLQCSSYDLEYCRWSNLPEDDFVLQDEKPWVLGEFVWTGFDYLGEPTPYAINWPARSSYFGIIDLAGIPKDRYYLYKSRWNTKEETLHILPHWNWKGREGKKTPVFVYTNYKKAELFINGKSQGVQEKKKTENKQERYRLMWNDVLYEPGTVKVIALDADNNSIAQKEIKTAGKPHHLELKTDRTHLIANGKDIAFVTLSIVDKDGNLCPNANEQLSFSVKGAGSFKAVCNGDPTSLEPFQKPTMKTFNGKLVVLIETTEKSGEIILKVEGENFCDKKLKLNSN